MPPSFNIALFGGYEKARMERHTRLRVSLLSTMKRLRAFAADAGVRLLVFCTFRHSAVFAHHLAEVLQQRLILFIPRKTAVCIPYPHHVHCLFHPQEIRNRTTVSTRSTTQYFPQLSFPHCELYLPSMVFTVFGNTTSLQLERNVFASIVC